MSAFAGAGERGLRATIPGLRNLGNTCYLGSALQILAAQPAAAGVQLPPLTYGFLVFTAATPAACAP